MAATRAKELPASWTAPLVRVLESRDDEAIAQALRVVRAAPAAGDAAADLRGALLRLGSDRSRSSIARLDALASVRTGLGRVEAEPFSLLLTSIESTNPLAIRTMAASAIETATLDREQLLALSAGLERAGPLELPRLLRAFDTSADETVGLAMVRALARAPARASLRPDVLGPRLDKYAETVRREGAALLESLQADAAKDAARLAALQAALGAGDRRRGQDVFNGQKAACSSCHTIGYIGGRLGPDLTSIGRVRTERDLLESVVFPSASFARGYEPVVVTLESGETRVGVLRTDARDYIVLVTGLRDETRIARDEIRDMQPASVSLMPPGLADQLTSQELADLIAFLLASVG
jgi:putative heme-binding domain-containing protein